MQLGRTVVEQRRTALDLRAKGLVGRIAPDFYVTEQYQRETERSPTPRCFLNAAQEGQPHG